MSPRPLASALALLALAASTAGADVEGPVTRLADVGGRADVLARADGSALAVWESGSSVHFCRVAAGAGTCTAATERTLTPAAAVGATTSRPFLFDLSGGRIVVVRGESGAQQHTYRWISSDNGGTFAAAVDFASVVPADQGAAVGPGDGISLLGEPARYQLAATTGSGKTTGEAVLDTSAGLTGAHAVSVDPSAGRPFAAWGTVADASAAGATTSSPNSAAGWSARIALSGVTGVRLSGVNATWVRDGRHEISRWGGTAFAPGTPFLHTPADAGEADIATDPAGGVHLVFSPPGSGAVCYARAVAGAVPDAPVLLGRDSAGVANLAVSATGPGQGRVVFTTGTSVGTVPLATGTLSPNVCGLAPGSLSVTRSAGRARVTVAVDPNAQNTTWHLEHGPTTDYGTSTPDVTIPGPGGPVSATVDLGALEPGAEHHVRLVAVNATGTAASPDLAFTPPAIAVPVRAAQVIRIPARCRSRRLTVGFSAVAGATPVLALLRVRGLEPLRVGPRRLGAGGITLTGLPRRDVALRVKVRLADGRVLRSARRFARCGRPVGLAR